MAKIIKGESVAAGGGAALARVVDAEVHAAAQHAKEIIARAEEEASRIVAAAEAERERVHAQAAEAGWQEGLGRATELLTRAEEARDRSLAEVEREVVRLSIAVAEKVLGRELRLDRGAVADIAVRALAMVRDRRSIVLRVNPGDFAALRERQAALAALLARCRALEIREDPGVPPGGAVVETEAGIVDARLETQLASLRRALEEVARP